MNATSNISLTYLELASIAQQNTQLSIFIVWVSLGFADAFVATFVMVTYIIWLPLKADVPALAINVAFVQILAGLSLLAQGCYHLYHVSFNMPQVTTKLKCYSVLWVRNLVMLLLAVFNTMISADRFISIVNPVYYRDRALKFIKYVPVFGWVITTVIIGFSFFDVTNETILVCIVRAATGRTYFDFQQYLIVSLSALSVLLYIIALVIVQVEMKTALKNGKNVSEIRKKLKNQATIALGVNAVLRLTLLSVASLTSFIFTKLNFGGSLGSYFGVLSYIGGISDFIIYSACRKQFRQGLRYLRAKIQQCSLGNSPVEPFSS